MADKTYILEAHRGVGTDAPENTLAALRLAKEQGYGMIEVDTKFTSDGRCVLLHDNTVNRTGRNADDSEIAPDTKISSLTFDEARALDFGVAKDAKYKGEKIPSLEEILAFAVKEKIPLKFDNVLASASAEQLESFFTTVENYMAVEYIGFTAFDTGFIKKVLDRFPTVQIHYDGPVNDETLAEVSELVPKSQLTVWMRYDNAATSWNTTPPVNRESAEKIHKIGKLGVWIIREESELRDAVNLYGADVIETDGTLKP